MPVKSALWERYGYAIAIGLLLIVPGLFSVNQIAARAVHDFFPPFSLAFWRWLGAFGVMLCFTGPRLWRERRTVGREWRDLLMLGFLGMFVCGAIVYKGGQTTTATNIGLIYAASPVAIILVTWAVYGDRLSALQATGAAAALAGVVVVITRGDPGVLTALAFTPGDLWIASAASSWAIYSILLAKRPSRLDMAARFTAICGAGCLCLLPFTIWETAQGIAAPLDLRSVATVAILVLVPSLGAYQGYAVVQRVLGTGIAGLVAYMSPIYNAGLAWVLLGEELQSHHLIGAALVLPGIYLATRKKKAA